MPRKQIEGPRSFASVKKDQEFKFKGLTHKKISPHDSLREDGKRIRLDKRQLVEVE